MTPAYRVIHLFKEIDQESVNEVSKLIIQINDSDEKMKEYAKTIGCEYNPEPIKLYIDSYGGECYPGFGLVSLIETSKTPVHSIVTGSAMSCALLISSSCHKRSAMEHSTLMFHSLNTVEWGKLQDVREGMIQTEEVSNKIKKITGRHTKMTNKQMEKIFKNKIDWYMNSKEALKHGFIDEIIKE